MTETIDYQIALQRCIETLWSAVVKGDADADLTNQTEADAPHHAKLVNEALSALRAARRDAERWAIARDKVLGNTVRVDQHGMYLKVGYESEPVIFRAAEEYPHGGYTHDIVTSAIDALSSVPPILERNDR